MKAKLTLTTTGTRQRRIWDRAHGRWSRTQTAEYLGLTVPNLSGWDAVGMGPEANHEAGPRSTFYVAAEVIAFGAQSGLHPIPESTAPVPTKIYRWQQDAMAQTTADPHLREVVVTAK